MKGGVFLCIDYHILAKRRFDGLQVTLRIGWSCDLSAGSVTVYQLAWIPRF